MRLGAIKRIEQMIFQKRIYRNLSSFLSVNGLRFIRSIRFIRLIIAQRYVKADDVLLCSCLYHAAHGEVAEEGYLMQGG